MYGWSHCAPHEHSWPTNNNIVFEPTFDAVVDAEPSEGGGGSGRNVKQKNKNEKNLYS